MVKRDFIRNVILLSVACILFLVLRLAVFDLYKVTDQSANAYVKAGDWIALMRHERPDYKDFVVYQVDGKSYMGRVVGLPKQAVTYMDDIFYLDSVVEDQTYLEPLKQKHTVATNGESPFTSDFTIETLTKGDNHVIPADYYLVLNDQRQNTQDSRTFGLISTEQLKGVVTFRLSPLNDFGFITVE